MLLLAVGPLLLGGAGCATVVKGTSQTITVYKKPKDADVRYQGRPVPDGRLFQVDKRYEPPSFVIRTPDGEHRSSVSYDIDPLFVVDCILLFPFVVPGLVAIGVDLSTGAWRDYHVHQHVDAMAFEDAFAETADDHASSADAAATSPAK